MASRAESRVFTIRQANEAVEDLRRTLPALRRTLHKIEQMEERLEVLDLICNRAVCSDNPDLQEYLTLRVQYHRAIAEFEGLLSGLDERGYLLRDLEKGVVHFIGQRKKKHVLLCWNEGEKEITHWHPFRGDGRPDESGRRRIEGTDEF